MNLKSIITGIVGRKAPDRKEVARIIHADANTHRTGCTHDGLFISCEWKANWLIKRWLSEGRVIEVTDSAIYLDGEPTRDFNV